MSDIAIFIGCATVIRDRAEQITMVFTEASEY